MISVQLQRSYVVPIKEARLEVVPIHASADVTVGIDQAHGNTPVTVVTGYSLICVCADGVVRMFPARVLREHVLTIPKMAPKGTLGNVDIPKRIEFDLSAPTSHDDTTSTPAPDKP